MFHYILRTNFSRNVRQLVKRIEISILGMDSHPYINIYTGRSLPIEQMVHICMQYPCLASFLSNIRSGHGHEIKFSLVLGQTCVNIRGGVGGGNHFLLRCMIL